MTCSWVHEKGAVPSHYSVGTTLLNTTLYLSCTLRSSEYLNPASDLTLHATTYVSTMAVCLLYEAVKCRKSTDQFDHEYIHVYTYVILHSVVNDAVSVQRFNHYIWSLMCHFFSRNCFRSKECYQNVYIPYVSIVCNCPYHV